MRALRLTTVFCATVAMAAVATPRPAEACGGFFCSTLPIDQTAEQIIFEITPGEFTAHIQVQFSGAAEDFAWVVPVNTVPELEISDPQLFNSLNFATNPTIIPPSCIFNSRGGGAPSAADGDGMNEGEAGTSGGVTVWDVSEVGPYDTATISADDSGVLVSWLRDNGYNITDSMLPIIDQYVLEGTLFMAMKLQPGEGVEALQPIAMTQIGDMPVIPLRLTAVAAEPNMGLLVWVLGDTRAVPANYSDVSIDHDRFRFDNSLQSNYRLLVTETIDEAGGQGWVTEFAGTTDTLFVGDEATQELLNRHDYITRFYATMNAEEMTIDPLFTFNSNLGDVSNIIDLSDRTDLCEVPFSPCDFNYCGPDSVCYEVSGGAACDCGDGYVARGVNGSNGPEVSCVPEDGDMLEEAGGNPCASSTCGEFGACVAINGQATCACDAGYVAVDDSGGVSCIDLTLAGTWNNNPSLTPGEDGQAGDEMGCAVAGTPGSVPALALLALVAGLVVRRRRTLN